MFKINVCFKNIPCTVFLYRSNSGLVFQGRLERQTGVEFLVACVHIIYGLGPYIFFYLIIKKLPENPVYILQELFPNEPLFLHCSQRLVKSEAIFAMSHVFPSGIEF